MKRQFTTAAPLAELEAPDLPIIGNRPAIVFGALPVLRGRAGANLLTGVHFDATPTVTCHTSTTLS